MYKCTVFKILPYQLIVVPSSEGEKAQLLGALQLSELAHPKRPGVRT